MNSKSKSRRRESFIARAERAGTPSVSIMAVAHTTDASRMPDAPAVAASSDSAIARLAAQRLIGAIAPGATANARLARLTASLEALMAADRAEQAAEPPQKRRAHG